MTVWFSVGAQHAAPLHRLSARSEEHTSELQSRLHLVCRLLLEKKKIALSPRRPDQTPRRRTRGSFARRPLSTTRRQTSPRRCRGSPRRSTSHSSSSTPALPRPP